MFPMVALADAWETEYKQIEQSIKQPEFKDKDYSITAFGASPNATAAVNPKSSTPLYQLVGKVSTATTCNHVSMPTSRQTSPSLARVPSTVAVRMPHGGNGAERTPMDGKKAKWDRTRERVQDC